MENKINYSFTPIPFVLGTYMDHYCYYLLGKLLGLAFTNQSNTFKTNNQNLQIITGLSKKVINATLSSLHRNGIITVECVGQAVSKTSNTITINTSKFEEYDKMGICTAYTDTDKLISIDKYDVKGYKVSYLQNNEETEEGVTTGNIKEEKPQPSSSVIDKVIDDFVETITSAETIDDEYEEEMETANNVTKDLPKVNISIAPATAMPPHPVETVVKLPEPVNLEEPIKKRYNDVTYPKNKEGWFDLLASLNYKFKDVETPSSFLSTNYYLIEELCKQYGLKNPQMTYSDSEPMYKYCVSKNYI